jgi:hypothetical protein
VQRYAIMLMNNGPKSLLGILNREEGIEVLAFDFA